MVGKYRTLEEFRGRYKDKEIWIVGPGPSFHDYPCDFFKDKIIITLNYMCLALPKSKFFFTNHQSVVEEARRKIPNCLEKFICCYLPDPNDPARYNPKKNLFGLGDVGSEMIYVPWERDPVPDRKSIFEKMAQNLLQFQNQSIYILMWSAIAHGAIEIAIFLGANQITLAGCDEQLRGNVLEAPESGRFSTVISRYKTFKEFRKEIEITFQEMRSGTKWLTEIFSNYGIKIQKYLYNEGYRRII